MESTLGASGTLGVIGSLPKTERRTRRRKASGVSSPAMSRGRSVDGTVTVGGQSLSSEYAREAIVEALSDAELVELVLAGEQDAFAVLDKLCIAQRLHNSLSRIFTG